MYKLIYKLQLSLLLLPILGCQKEAPSNVVFTNVPSITVSNIWSYHYATFSCITNEHGVFLVGIGDQGAIAIYGVQQ